MAPKDFLRTLWPDAGPYVLMWFWHKPELPRPAACHKTFDTLDAAAAYAARKGKETDTFWAMSTVKDVDFVNPKNGKKIPRHQLNSKRTRCFWLDIDVGPSKDYATRDEAVAAIDKFLEGTGLPLPLVVNSGFGIHLYWPLEDEMDSDDWTPHAFAMKALAEKYGLKADHSCTTDNSRVLRMPGTINMHRDPTRPDKGRWAKVVREATRFPNDLILTILDPSIVKTQRATSNKGPAIAGAAPTNMLGGQGGIEKEFEETTLDQLLKVCKVASSFDFNGPQIPEPVWYFFGAGTLQYVEGGREWFHEVSSEDPRYDHGAAEAKLAQWVVQSNDNPVSCEKIQHECGELRCKGCPFFKAFGNVRNPLQAARKGIPSAPPVVIAANGVQQDIPEPPYPFRRRGDDVRGIDVIIPGKKDDGPPIIAPVLDEDLFPIETAYCDKTQMEVSLWMLQRQHDAPRVFEAAGRDMSSPQAAAELLASKGCYVYDAKRAQEYMSAYLRKITKRHRSTIQFNHLGWMDKKFALPDQLLNPDGTASSITLTREARVATSFIEQQGSLVEQQKLLEFYNLPEYIPHQFVILNSLGSILLSMTIHAGLWLNMTGESGASKSSAQLAAASLWGDPFLYTKNGTHSGATKLSRELNRSILCSLPFFFDEVTTIPDEEIKEMAMNVSQRGPKERAGRDGTLREQAARGMRANIICSTSNVSLHTRLAFNNVAGTAGSVRVFEINMLRQEVHQNYEADDMVAGLSRHYGWIGPLFARYVTDNYEAVEKRLNLVMRELAMLGNQKQDERFWFVGAAVALVAGEIAYEQGWLKYDVKAIKEWLLRVQIPAMRGAVKDEHDQNSPINLLTSFLAAINGNTIKIRVAQQFKDAAQRPSGALYAHMDLINKDMWVTRQSFREFCTKRHQDFIKTLTALALSGHVRAMNVKRTLGLGTELAGIRQNCFEVNLDHPDFQEMLDTERKLAEEEGSLPQPKKVALRSVP